MTLYKTSRWDPNIETIEATRETKDSYWILDKRGRECRNLKITKYHRVFPTYEEAKQYLIDSVLAKIKSTESNLKEFNIELEKYKRL